MQYSPYLFNAPPIVPPPIIGKRLAKACHASKSSCGGLDGWELDHMKYHSPMLVGRWLYC